MFQRIFRTSGRAVIYSSRNRLSISQTLFRAPVREISQNTNEKTSPRIKPFQEKDDPSLLIAQNDPDTFGLIGREQLQELEEEDEGDIREEEYLQNPPNKYRQLGMRQYADMIKKYFEQKKVYEAIDVLEKRMLKEDKVKPTNYIYNLLIGGCARAGYTKKAFQLYTNMKQRDLKVTGGTYTSLFNACSNSPYRNDGLEKAKYLREKILQSGYVLNVSNYNAMIKAFGRLGDIETAFQLVDEMQTQKLPVRSETYCFLLQACASDKELGFRHALLVWQKMHRRRMEMNHYLFNLMIRCARDCGLGDAETTKQLIEEIIELSNTKKPKEIESPKEEILRIGEPKIEEDTIKIPVAVETHEIAELNMPNLLTPLPRLGNLVAIKDVVTPEDRFLLLGGLLGFLKEMDRQKITPNIKTFTQLLEVIPCTLSAEKLLIREIRERVINCDIDFFNILIKKRALRSDFEGAAKVLKMIKTANLKPDIVTYGVLALACQSEEQARALLNEMDSKGIR